MTVSSTGAQAKYLLESTFDVVANGSVVCMAPSATYTFKAIIHDEIVRARREHLSAENDEGIVDRNSKRIILLTRDIIAAGLEQIDASWYLLIKGVRFDFSTNEPFCDMDTTPYAGAEEVFSVFYTRRAEELESAVVPGSTGQFSFNSWALIT